MVMSSFFFMSSVTEPLLAMIQLAKLLVELLGKLLVELWH